MNELVDRLVDGEIAFSGMENQVRIVVTCKRTTAAHTVTSWPNIQHDCRWSVDPELHLHTFLGFFSGVSHQMAVPTSGKDSTPFLTM